VGLAKISTKTLDMVTSREALLTPPPSPWYRVVDALNKLGVSIPFPFFGYRGDSIDSESALHPAAMLRAGVDIGPQAARMA